jgi:hypothetical protein
MDGQDPLRAMKNSTNVIGVVISTLDINEDLIARGIFVLTPKTMGWGLWSEWSEVEVTP